MDGRISIWEWGVGSEADYGFKRTCFLSSSQHGSDDIDREIPETETASLSWVSWFGCTSLAVLFT